MGSPARRCGGRTCPPASTSWREAGLEPPEEPGSAEPQGGASGRARGRFTRNFVVQATAADWALALLGSLRRRLTPFRGPELVFFQHDEVIVHTPAGLAGDVTAAVHAAADEARRLLFGDTPVRFPMEVAVVDRYADAK